MGNLLNGLNKEQRQAATSESNIILCLAGAGTGKTRTLTHRIAYLNDNRISCSNMLALTFTRLAGKEMKERVIKLVGENEGEKLFCNTFHAFCVKVLKEWGYLLGYDSDFSIYDQEDRESIIKNIIGDLCYGNETNAKTIISILEGNRDIDCGEEDEIIKEYYYRLKRNNAFDLDMLLTQARGLLKDQPHVREEYHDQYEFVFVDEFQDTNDIQMEIIKALNPRNLFIVGDDFQSIYGWRNANPEYIINFQEYYPDVDIIKLEENYRSTEQIIKAANTLIKHNTNQTEKKLITNMAGQKIEILEGFDIDNESNIIVAKILEYVKGNYRDFAVLTRTNKQIEPLAEAFKKFEIPYQIISNKEDPLKKPDIRKVLNVIEFAVNPKDNMLLKKVINFPMHRVSGIEIEELELNAIEHDVYLSDAIEKYSNVKARKFIDNICYLLRDRETYSALDIFNDFIKELGLFKEYENEGRQNKMSDIVAATVIIRKWSEQQIVIREDPSIYEFLKWIHLKDIQEKLMDDRNAVKLMTVHASKGLEFENVFVIGMNQNIFPNYRADIEEERRLFYVAITRAKKRLFLTRAKEISTWGKKTIDSLESQFIREIQEDAYYE